MFEVREKGTEKLVGLYTTRGRANTKRDNLDNQYGCYHYYVVNLELEAMRDKSTEADIVRHIANHGF